MLHRVKVHQSAIRSCFVNFHPLTSCITWRCEFSISEHPMSLDIHRESAKNFDIEVVEKKESNPIISVSTTGCYAMPFRSRQRELNSSAKQQENNKITRFCVRDEISRWKVFCCFSVFLAIFSCERKNIFLMLRWKKKKKNKKIRWEWFTASVLEVILMLARIRNVSLTLFSEAFVIIKTWRDPSTCFIVFRVASAHARDTNIICRSCWCHCVVKTKKRCPLWETIHERLFVFAEKLHRRKTRRKFFINAAREKKLIFANWKSEWRRQSPDAIIFGGKWSTSSFYVNKFSRHRVKLTRKVASRKLRPADVIALFPCLFKRNSKQKYFPRKLSTRSGIGARVSNHNFSSPNQSPKNQRKSSVGRCGSDKNALDQLAGAKFIPFWSNLHVINSFFTSSHGRCKQLTSCFPSQPSSQPR